MKETIECLQKTEWKDLQKLPDSPIEFLIRIADRLNTRSEMEASTINPEERAKLTLQLNELQDRESLSRILGQVEQQVKQLRLMKLLKKCQDDCSTNHITAKNAELFETFVDSTFCNTFSVECERLGLVTLKARMECTKNTKGERRFGIRITVGKKGPAVQEVASEGENRCIALAAFLTELSLASHKSALVFDDPVSSLDHNHRLAVATRLVEEAQQRQVVIFTHDACFLSDLLDLCNEKRIEPACRHVFWNGNIPGYCEAGLPWDVQKYKERLNALEQEQAALKKSWSLHPSAKDIQSMRTAYGHYRATLERVLQDVIFNGVITRFRSWIRVDNLEAVAGFSQAECAEVLRLHKRACDVTDAHDPASQKQANVPTPSELLNDIDAMKALVETIRKRRKDAERDSHNEANVVPVTIISTERQRISNIRRGTAAEKEALKSFEPANNN